MRIAIVANPASPHVQRWASALENRGHVVRMFAPAGLDYSCEREVVEFGSPDASGLWATYARGRELGRAIRDSGADIVHAHFILNYGTWAVLSGIRPVVLSAWGSDLFIAPKASISNALKVRHALKRADAVTYNSAELGRAAADLGAPSARLHQIVFGVDTTVFAPRATREPESPVTFLSTRQLKELYHIEDIIQAFAAAHIADKARLVISSFGPEGEALAEMAQALGVGGAVHFTGRISDQEMVEAYKTADVYVTVPESDSIAVSLLEAMSCGLPAIASNLAPNREWLGENREGGLLAEVGDVTALAQAMRELAINGPLRQHMGERNRAVVLRDADWHTEVDKMEELFERLVAARSRR